MQLDNHGTVMHVLHVREAGPVHADQHVGGGCFGDLAAAAQFDPVHQLVGGARQLLKKLDDFVLVGDAPVVLASALNVTIIQ